jgi:RNA polymerase sigma-70 factor, ECF subfamily
MKSALLHQGKQAKDYDAANAVKDLLKVAPSESHSSFEALQRTYSQRLFKQIIAITRHQEDAEDALQDSLCKAFVALPRFEQRSHIYTWLSRIAINCALMKVRKRRSLRELSFDRQDHTQDEEPWGDLPDPGWSPEELFRAEERLQQIVGAIQTLDPISKQVIRLRADDEHSIAEIATILNISVPAVKSRLYRSRHVLRVLVPEQVYSGAAAGTL